MDISMSNENEEEEVADDMSFETAQEATELQLDCYPYTFSPLLLFTSEGYFDKGYSNYHAVAAFFQSCISTNMLDNVLCDRKNMLYEDLLNYIVENEMLVTCCIDAHFTAFQVLASNKKKPCLLYYDPMDGTCKLATGENFKYVALFLMMKCGYGDGQHVTDNKDYYTGAGVGGTRRTIFQMWQKVNQYAKVTHLYSIKFQKAFLNLDQYYLVNDGRNPRLMSTQLTGNTCYFQTFLYVSCYGIHARLWGGYDGTQMRHLTRQSHSANVLLCCVGGYRGMICVQFSLASLLIPLSSFHLLRFGVLCKVCKPALNRDGRSIDCSNLEQLLETTINMSRFLLTFFVDPTEGVMRPLSNSNIVLDFFRFKQSAYFTLVTRYLKLKDVEVPDYEDQYQQVMRYFQETKVLHSYRKFTLDGTMSSTPNTKQLQAVYSTEDASSKLASHNYYKYRAANLMFGFHAGIIKQLHSFCEFNALRKNQLLGFYNELEDALSGIAEALSSTSNKYRDYCMFRRPMLLLLFRDSSDPLTFASLPSLNLAFVDFMPQFELGQQQLVDVHHYLYLLDLFALENVDRDLESRVHAVNELLVNHLLFSTSKSTNYDKILPLKDVIKSKSLYRPIRNGLMTIEFFTRYIGESVTSPRSYDAFD